MDYLWDSASGRPGGERRREYGNRETPDDWEPDEMPIHESFWTNYRKRLFACSGTLAMATPFFVYLVSAGAMNLAIAFLMAGLVAVIVSSMVLPVYWYLSHRRVRQMYADEHETIVDEASGEEQTAAGK